MGFFFFISSFVVKISWAEINLSLNIQFSAEEINRKIRIFLYYTKD